MRRILTLALTALIAGLFTTMLIGEEPKKETAKAPAQSSSPTPEAELGLARGSVTDTLSPDPVVPESTDPGVKPPLQRWNRVAPPMIPHGVADALPITRDANACVDCHLIDKQEEGDPTPIPVSHRAETKAGESAAVTGKRWVCTACHASLTDAKPLPASTRPAAKKP